jgi:hypothetical protein
MMMMMMMMINDKEDFPNGIWAYSSINYRLGKAVGYGYMLVHKCAGSVDDNDKENPSLLACQLHQLPPPSPAYKLEGFVSRLFLVSPSPAKNLSLPPPQVADAVLRVQRWMLDGKKHPIVRWVSVMMMMMMMMMMRWWL